MCLTFRSPPCFPLGLFFVPFPAVVPPSCCPVSVSFFFATLLALFASDFRFLFSAACFFFNSWAANLAARIAGPDSFEKDSNTLTPDAGTGADSGGNTSRFQEHVAIPTLISSRASMRVSSTS